MKRSEFFLFLTLIIFLIFSCAKEPTVDELVNQMAQALGGKEQLAAVKDMVSTWETKIKMPAGTEQQEAMEKEKSEQGEEQEAEESKAMQEQIMNVKISYKRPAKIRYDVMTPDGQTVETSAFDGTTGWKTDASGQIMDLNGAELQQMEWDAKTWVDGITNYKELGYTLEKLPDEEVEGIKYKVLKCTDNHGNVFKLYVNPQTHFMERMSGEMVTMEGKKERGTFVMKDFKAVDGISMPHWVARLDSKNNKMWEASLKEVKINTGVEDAIFMKPQLSVVQ